MRFYLTLVLFFYIHSFFSQKMYFSANTGVNFGRTDWGDFKEYIKEYNYDNRKTLKTNLGKMNWTSGYNFGISFVATNATNFGAILELENENKFGHTSAKFIDPAFGTRHFKVRYSSNIYSFGMAASLNNGAFMFLSTFLGTNNIYLESYKKYEDGMISYGLENGLNSKHHVRRFTAGISIGFEYHFNRFIAANAGFKTGFTLFGANEIKLPTDSGSFEISSMNFPNVFNCGLKFLILNSY